MKATQREIRLGGRRVDYRVTPSMAARKIRVRVGPGGVEVVQPAARTVEDVSAFLNGHEEWILDQLQRVERLGMVRQPAQHRADEILFRGEATRLRIETTGSRMRSNAIAFANGEIVIKRGTGSRTPLARSLENWLRRQARAAIEAELAAVIPRLGQQPGRVYVMGQRTKWGNCSARRNLSFNWRLVLGPEFVLRYLVTHEAVHLAVLDHSAKFWFTVQSLCPETEKARQWLRTRAHELGFDPELAYPA